MLTEKWNRATQGPLKVMIMSSLFKPGVRYVSAHCTVAVTLHTQHTVLEKSLLSTWDLI